ncbi:MAG: hypothetical protein LAT55_08365 [Opitutales bacterium]|nr:hypothetical protein [Opitutales bacterium]
MKAVRLSLISLGILGLLILGIISLLLLPPVQKALFVRYLEADGIMKAEVDGFRVGWRTVTIDNLQLERRNDRYGTDRATITLSLGRLLRGQGLHITEGDLGNVYFIYHERDPDEEDPPKRERPFQGIVEEIREAQKIESPDDDPAFPISIDQLKGQLNWAYHTLNGSVQQGEVSLELAHYQPETTAVLSADGWYRTSPLAEVVEKLPFTGQLTVPLSKQSLWTAASLQIQAEVLSIDADRSPLPLNLEATWRPTSRGEQTEVSLQAYYREASAISLEHQLDWNGQDRKWRGDGKLRIDPALLSFFGKTSEDDESLTELSLSWTSDEEWKVFTTALSADGSPGLLRLFLPKDSDLPDLQSLAELNLAFDANTGDWFLNRAELHLSESGTRQPVLAFSTTTPLRGNLKDPWQSIEFQDEPADSYGHLHIPHLPLDWFARVLPTDPLAIAGGVLTLQGVWDQKGWTVEELSVAELLLQEAPPTDESIPERSRTKRDRQNRERPPSDPAPHTFNGILYEIDWPRWLHLESLSIEGRGLYSLAGNTPTENAFSFDFQGENLGAGQTSRFQAMIKQEGPERETWKNEWQGGLEIRPDGKLQRLFAHGHVHPPEELAIPPVFLQKEISRRQQGESYQLHWSFPETEFQHDYVEVSGAWFQGNNETPPRGDFSLTGSLSPIHLSRHWPWLPNEGLLVPQASAEWNPDSGEIEGQLEISLESREPHHFLTPDDPEAAQNLVLHTPFSWRDSTLALPHPSLSLGGDRPYLRLVAPGVVRWSAAEDWSGWADQAESPVGILEIDRLPLKRANHWLGQEPWSWSKGELHGLAHFHFEDHHWRVTFPEPLTLRHGVLQKHQRPFLNFDKVAMPIKELLFNQNLIHLQALQVDSLWDDENLFSLTIEELRANPQKRQGTIRANGQVNLPAWRSQPGLQDYHNARSGNLRWGLELSYQAELTGSAKWHLEDLQTRSPRRHLPEFSGTMKLEPAAEGASFTRAEMPITMKWGEQEETLHNTIVFSLAHQTWDILAESVADKLTLPQWTLLQGLFQPPPERVPTGPSGRPLKSEDTFGEAEELPHRETTEPTLRADEMPFWNLLRGEWSVRVDKLHADEGWDFDNFRQSLQFTENRFEKYLDFRIAGADWRVRSLITHKGSTDPSYSWRANLDFADFEPAQLLNPGAPADAPFSGTFKGRASISSAQKPLESLFSDWQGEIKITGQSGRIRALAADERAGRYAGLAGGVAGLLGDIGRRPELTAIAELTRFFSDFPYDHLDLQIERDHTLDTSLPNLRVQSPDFLLTGSGIMPHREGRNYLDQPFLAELRLGARNDLARWMQALRLLESEPQQSGYHLMNRSIPLRGTPRQPDLQTLTDFIIQTGLEATGLRRRSTEDRSPSSPNREDDLRDLLPRIFR